MILQDERVDMKEESLEAAMSALGIAEGAGVTFPEAVDIARFIVEKRM
jgi:hypothetical protein